MKEATKRATSAALAHMLAVTAMLVIASVLFYGNGHRQSVAQGMAQGLTKGLTPSLAEGLEARVTFSK
jgi:hypothetical protein